MHLIIVTNGATPVSNMDDDDDEESNTDPLMETPGSYMTIITMQHLNNMRCLVEVLEDEMEEGDDENEIGKHGWLGLWSKF